MIEKAFFWIFAPLAVLSALGSFLIPQIYICVLSFGIFLLAAAGLCVLVKAGLAALIMLAFSFVFPPFLLLFALFYSDGIADGAERRFNPQWLAAIPVAVVFYLATLHIRPSYDFLPFQYYFNLAAVIFVIGMAGMIFRKNIVNILMAFHVMVTAAFISLLFFHGARSALAILAVCFGSELACLSFLPGLFREYDTLQIDGFVSKIPLSPAASAKKTVKKPRAKKPGKGTTEQLI